MFRQYHFIGLLHCLVLAAILLFPITNKVHAQIPDGLLAVGVVVNPDFVPGSDPNVVPQFISNLYLIDESTYTGSPIAILNRHSYISGGLAVLGTTIYGTNLTDHPNFMSDFYTGTIALDGTVSSFTNQGVSPNRNVLAANHAENVLYTIEAGTLMKIHPDGSTEIIGPTGINPTGMAYNDIGGDLFAMTEMGWLYLISTVDGSSQFIAPLQLMEAEFALTYDECNGVLFILESLLGGLYSIDVHDILQPGPLSFVGFTEVPAVSLTNNGKCVIDTDNDGQPDIIDTDDDNDGVDDVEDADPLDNSVCSDIDNDTCDDCSQQMFQDPSNDGPDSDGDGICDAGDTSSCDCSDPNAITQGFNFWGRTFFFGTFQDDVICGSSSRDIIFAFGGNDCIDSGEGNDKVFAGSGDDNVTLGPGNDRAFGGPGNDDIDGGEGRDLALGGFGTDFCDAETTIGCEIEP